MATKTKPEPVQTEEDPEFVSPTREPERIPDIDINAEAERIFGDDLADPEAVQAEIDAMDPQVKELVAVQQEIDRRVTAFRGLHAKLTEVILEVGYIQKTGTAPKGMGGYSFVEAGKIAAKLRMALASRGVTMLPEHIEQVGDLVTMPTSGRPMLIQTVKQTWRLTDSETGETAVIQSMGTGGDTGDKFSPKAQTNAMKYALQVGFLLETGDDPEKFDLSDTPQGPGITITGSNIEGVQQGGRQTQITGPQLDAIRTHARRLDLDPESFAVLIGSALGGKAPEIGDEETVIDQQRAILAFCGELDFAEAGTLIQTLETTDPILDDSLGPEDVGAK